MKFLYLTVNYSPYLKDFYSRHPGAAQHSFAQQSSRFEADAFGWNGGWGPALESLGYEYMEVIANARPLQKAWADEHSLAWPELSWKTSVPFAQIEAFKPDILFTDAPRDFEVAWLKEIRQRCSSIRLIVGWSQSPCDEFEVLRYYDLLLSGSHYMLDHYRGQGCKTEFLRLGFNRRVLSHLTADVGEDPAVTFSGSVARGHGRHGERERLLDAIARSSIPLRLLSAPPGVTPFGDALSTAARVATHGAMRLLSVAGVPQRTRRRLPFIGKAATWTSVPERQVSRDLWPYMKPAVYGLEMYQALRRAAVSLNIHIDCTGPDAANLRLFEATGVGSCLLTDFKPNLPEMFEVDKEVVCYRSVDECIEKSKWLLAHPLERCSIAAAGQARTLRDHTVENRASELDSILLRLLAAKTTAAVH